MRPTALFRIAAAIVVFVAVVLASVSQGRADSIAARSAELRLEEDWYVLDAEFDLVLNPTLEEAIGRGVALYFAVEFELHRPRWYWLDDTVVQTAFTWLQEDCFDIASTVGFGTEV